MFLKGLKSIGYRLTDPRCPLGLFNTPAVYCVFKSVRVVGSRLSVVGLVGTVGFVFKIKQPSMFLPRFIFPRLLSR